MSREALSAENEVATWSVSLDATCPACDEDVDLLEAPDFWDGRNSLKIGMSHRFDKEASDVEVMCPSCEHHFKVNLEW